MFLARTSPLHFFVASIITTISSSERLHPCPNIPDWFECPKEGGGSSSSGGVASNYGMCVSESQLCDGKTDCFESG